jgi:hypothetical protein
MGQRRRCWKLHPSNRVAVGEAPLQATTDVRAFSRREPEHLRVLVVAPVRAHTPAAMYRYFTMEIERPQLSNVEAWYRRLQERPPYREDVQRCRTSIPTHSATLKADTAGELISATRGSPSIISHASPCLRA